MVHAGKMDGAALPSSRCEVESWLRWDGVGWMGWSAVEIGDGVGGWMEGRRCEEFLYRGGWNSIELEDNGGGGGIVVDISIAFPWLEGNRIGR